jgi:hypothetical protein
MDGAEIAAATLCGTDNCPTCECPKAELDNTEETFPFRKTSDVKKAVEDGRARLLNADESVKANKKSAVRIPYNCVIYTIKYIMLYTIVYIIYSMIYTMLCTMIYDMICSIIYTMIYTGRGVGEAPQMQAPSTECLFRRHLSRTVPSMSA